MALSSLSPSKLNSESISNWFKAPSSSLSPSLSPSKPIKSSSNTTTTMSASSTTIFDTNNHNNTTITPKHDRNSNSHSRSSSKTTKDSLSSWRESSSSPFLDEIDQENVAPVPAFGSTSVSSSSPQAEASLLETPTGREKRSTGLRESPYSPLATLGATDDATAADTATATATSAGRSRSARRRYHYYQGLDEDATNEGHDNFQICTDETRTAGSPEKRIADVMLRSVDMTPSRSSRANAAATISPRTKTATSGLGFGDSGGITASECGLLPGSAIKHGRCGNLAATSDESPSKKSPGGGLQTIAKDSVSPGTRDESTATADEQGNIDDTCFTAFSEIPNAEVTQFTKMPPAMRQMVEDHNATPKNRRPHSPLAHSPSPSPLRHANHKTNDPDMTNLLDFTQQMESFSNASRKSPSRFNPTSPMKFQSQPNLLSFINNQRSPAKANGMPSTPAERQSILNLLDFELPPAPTPRSIPTVTARELESLKSQYLSEISSLKATLSGKCAEVDSLKKAVNDAERRVGQAQEELREECSAKEHAERERTVWEKKGKEVEEILQAIRKEVMSNEKEMEQLEGRLQESERRAEDAEAREADAKTATVEAERKVATLAATAAAAATDSTTGLEQEASADLIAKQVQKELDEKIGGISSELHAVYKKKHETKVATLKKSYEARAEKKCAELQKKIGELSKQNEELQLSKDATFSGVLPKDIPSTNSQQADLKLLEEQKVEIEQQRARLVGMVTELESVKGQQTHLLRELEIERAEKGELVAAAEEMLGLQHDSASAGVGVDDFRKSISRCSGLRPPAASSIASSSSSLESKIGRVGVGGGGGATGLVRPAIGLKSKMMSNIERMGGGGL